MPVSLPKAWIKTDDRIGLIEALRTIALQQGSYTELAASGSPASEKVACLRPVILGAGTSQNGLDLFAWREDMQAVDVQVRWLENNESTYDSYVNELRRIAGSLLREYNKSQGGRFRLSIQSKASMISRLPPRAKRYFDHFVAHANKSHLHENDWIRFHYFVKVAPKNLGDDLLRRLLLEAGFSPEQAEDASFAFGQLQLFLRPLTAASILELHALRTPTNSN